LKSVSGHKILYDARTAPTTAKYRPRRKEYRPAPKSAIQGHSERYIQHVEQVAKEAKERQIQAGKDFGIGHEKVGSNLTQAIDANDTGRTAAELAADPQQTGNRFVPFRQI